MPKAVKRSAAAFAAALFAIQLVQPDHANPAVDASQTLYTLTATPPAVREILDRSCRDCHSDETRWPWYSNVAPVSWLVARDVEDGRSHLNMSEWGRYGASEAGARLLWMSFAAREGTMPPASYLRLHPEARLSEADVRALGAWVESESK